MLSWVTEQHCRQQMSASIVSVQWWNCDCVCDCQKYSGEKQPCYTKEHQLVFVWVTNSICTMQLCFTGDINTNTLGVRVDTTNPTNAFVECLSHQPGYTCTIDYGTDLSYTNLVYRYTSSTQGRRTTITLSQRLRGDTTYYYTVSAESSSECVRVRGRFQTGGYFL